MKQFFILPVLLPTLLFAQFLVACPEPVEKWNGTANMNWYDAGEPTFTLCTAEELAGLAALVNLGTSFANKTVELGADIDLDDIDWAPIGNSSSSNRFFTGTFDGKGHTISGLHINVTTNNQGLFGYFGGTVMNLGLDDFEVNGGNYVSGLIGYVNATSTIRNVWAKGIAAGTTVGGLVGYRGTGTLTIVNSYSAVSLTGTTKGGLVGSGAATITNSFYDSEKSGTTNNILGTGLLTEEIQSEDFVHYMEDYVLISGDAFNIAGFFETDGEGSENKPYVIKTKRQLRSFATMVNLGKERFTEKFVALGSDIALGNFRWTPIGTSSTNRFYGTFDGKSHAVSGVRIASGDYQGFFGYFGGTAMNLGLDAFNISGGTNGINIGSLIGYVSTATDIKNVWVNGTVSGSTNIGGLVGYANAALSISNSYTLGSASGTSSSSRVGGLVGYRYAGDLTISNSYSALELNAGSSTTNKGGLVGSGGTTGTTVANSYFDNEKSGSVNSGPGTGLSTAEMQSEDFAHHLEDRAIIAEMAGVKKWLYTAGNYPKLSSTNIPAFDIANFFEAGGAGSDTNPYVIKTNRQLRSFGTLVNLGKEFFAGKFVALDSDIELGNFSWTPIGTTATNYFRGTFDGKGKTISGININTTANYQGLFGYFGGTAKNLGLEAFYITGGQFVGSLAGRVVANSVIINVWVSGNVSGTNYAGGLIGGGAGGSELSIANSYTLGAVTLTGTTTNSTYLGGLVGRRDSLALTIANSYAAVELGAISTNTTYKGGLAGGTTTSTAISSIVVSNSYFDNAKSGTVNANPGIGLPAAEMQSQDFAHYLEDYAMISKIDGAKKWLHSIGNYPKLGLENVPAYSVSDFSYTITSKRQLRHFEILVNLGNNFSGKYIELGADIVELGEFNWRPIGATSATAFAGTFDGKGYKISSMRISYGSNYQGLFGYFSGTVMNLGLDAFNVTGAQYTGGLIGQINVKAVIKNVWLNGNVTGTTNVGGFVGYVNGGTNDTLLISNSYMLGNITATSYAGGFVGRRYSGYLTITNSYSAVEFIPTGTSISSKGGLAGGSSTANIVINNSFYDNEKSGTTNNTLGMSLPTTDMQSEEFVYILNDYAMMQNVEDALKWKFEKDNYPVFGTENLPEYDIAYFFDGGDGTAIEPYIITTDRQLKNFATFVNTGIELFSGKFVALGKDIELNPANQWTPIGAKYENRFSGTFDGRGFKVSGVNIKTTSSYQGFFGYLDGTVKNLGLEGINIEAGYYTGGLAGYVYNATISNVWVNGDVKGDRNVGGLVGYVGYVANRGHFSITNSYVIGNLSAASYAGGLLGYTDSPDSNFVVITNSYAAAKLNSDGSYKGGLVGRNDRGYITINNSYYDITQTNIKSLGIGLSTSEMQSEDFANILNDHIMFFELSGALKWKHIADNYPEFGTGELPTYNLANYFEPGGIGTEANPYVIKTKMQLRYFANIVNSGKDDFALKFVTLGADIELNNTANWASWNDNSALMQWTPIGTSAHFFKGTFDGKGYKISGLYISGSGYNQGLFGYFGGNLRNLKLENFYISASQNVGAAIGYIGGQLGASSDINNVWADKIKITASVYVGGLFGNIYNSTAINNCYFKGNLIVSSGAVGGIVGYSEASMMNLRNSYAIGTINASNTSIGGLIGSSSNYASISNSYASVSFIGSATNRTNNLIGSSYSNYVYNSYFDAEAANVSSAAHGIGLTKAEMQSEGFVELLNDYASMMGFGSSPTFAKKWKYSAGNYPEFSSDNLPEFTGVGKFFQSGNGEKATPYVIQNKWQLRKFAMVVNANKESFANKYVVLGADIELNAADDWEKWSEEDSRLNWWQAIGTTTSFNGNFDGRNHVVKGLYSNYATNGQNNPAFGLFGNINTASIENVEAKGFFIKGYYNVGAIAGYARESSINNVHATGILKGYTYVGGLVGYARKFNSAITDVSFNGTITGNSYDIGGLVGYIDSSKVEIKNSNAQASINAQMYVGGLVGRSSHANNSGFFTKIIESYSISNVIGVDYVGGLIGFAGARDSIIASYAKGKVTMTTGTTSGVGGLSGVGGHIVNSYAIVDVQGNNYLGGITGSVSNGSVTNCYASGTITGVGVQAGGVTGSGSYLNSYYNKDKHSYGNTGSLTAAQMALKTNFANWDFETVWDIDPDRNDGMPYLQWDIPYGEFPAINTIFTKVYEDNLKLGDVILPSGYAWRSPHTMLSVGEEQEFAVIHRTSENVLSRGNAKVTITKNNGQEPEFPPATAYATYKEGLTLNEVVNLPSGYSWVEPNLVVETVGNMEFEAVYAWNYKLPIGGMLTLVVSKNPGEAPEFPTITIDTLYRSGLTLANIKLPSGYFWLEPSTPISAPGNGLQFDASHDHPNYAIRSQGKITVNVTDGDARLSIDSWTYGEPSNIPVATSTTNGAATSFVYTGKTNGSIDYNDTKPPTQAGQYMLTATFPAKGVYGEAKRTAMFTVERAIGLGQVSIESWKFGATTNQPVAESPTNGTLGLSYIYRSANNASYAPQSTWPSNPGQYMLIAIFPETHNYLEVRDTTFFIISNATATELTVIWDKNDVFTYNKMVQYPVPSVEYEGKKIKLTLLNAQSEVGKYDGMLKARAIIEDEAVAKDFVLLNNTKSYEIVKKPLLARFTVQIPTDDFDAKGDTIWIPRSTFQDSIFLRSLLTELVDYSGFATDTTGGKKESDNASVLSGSPVVKISYEAAIVQSVLAKRVETTQKATATIVTDNISAKNYDVLSREIVVMEAFSEVSGLTQISCKRNDRCALMSKESCEIIGGEEVATCPNFCVIASGCAEMSYNSCMMMGGEPVDKCLIEMRIAGFSSGGTFRVWQSVSGMINVDLGYMPATAIALQIYDLNGKLITTEQVNTRFAKVRAGIASGIYLFKVGKKSVVVVLK